MEKKTTLADVGPKIDPFIYDEKTWPKLSMQEKLDASMKWTCFLLVLYHKIMREELGFEKAQELAGKIWKFVIQDIVEGFAEVLGTKGMKNAIAVCKPIAYIEEEIIGEKAHTLEATPDRAVRCALLCPEGEVCLKEDCDIFMAGFNNYFKEALPDYECVMTSRYQDTHICRYEIRKKKK